MAKITISVETWPITRCQFPSEFSDSEMTDFISQFVALPKRKENYVMVVDLSHSMIPTRKQGADAKDVIDRQRDPLRRYLRGVAMIIESAALRTTMNAIMLFIRPPYPTRFLKSQAEADGWCVEQLKQSAAA
jgi:hypothetical protein